MLQHTPSHEKEWLEDKYWLRSASEILSSDGCVRQADRKNCMSQGALAILARGQCLEWENRVKLP